jgi:hypothetical protein
MTINRSLLSLPACRLAGRTSLFRLPSEIKRAFRLFHGPARHAVGIDHRCSDIRMPEQRLDRANVVVRLQEMSGEAVAEGMGRYAL